MITIHDLRAWKADGNPVGHAHRLRLPHRPDPRPAGVPVLLVGDSVGRQRPGVSPTSCPVTMDEMLHHTRAVARGVERAMVVGDMPFMSFQASHRGRRPQRRPPDQGGRRPRGQDRGRAVSS